MNQQMIPISMHTTGDCIQAKCVRVCVRVGEGELVLAPATFQTPSISAELYDLWESQSELQSTSPESPDDLIWERREIRGTSPWLPG